VEGVLESEACASALTNPPDRTDVRVIATTWHPVFRLPTQTTERAPSNTRSRRWRNDGEGNLMRRTITAPRDDGSATTISRTVGMDLGHAGPVATATDPTARSRRTAITPDDDPDVGRRGNLRA